VGREYEPVVRINSQSGKGGVAFVMETVYGYKIPKEMQRDFADVIQKISEKQGGEVEPALIMETFRDQYLSSKEPFEFIRAKVNEHSATSDDVEVSLEFKYMFKEMKSVAEGNGPIDAAILALRQCVSAVDVSVLNYTEHALSEGSHAKAAAYIQMRNNKTGRVEFGVGVSSNITRASIKAMFSALNRLVK
jgi:2-isopropylmalate synthase